MYLRDGEREGENTFANYAYFSRLSPLVRFMGCTEGKMKFSIFLFGVFLEICTAKNVSIFLYRPIECGYASAISKMRSKTEIACIFVLRGNILRGGRGEWEREEREAVLLFVL